MRPNGSSSSSSGVHVVSDVPSSADQSVDSEAGSSSSSSAGFSESSCSIRASIWLSGSTSSEFTSISLGTIRCWSSGLASAVARMRDSTGP